MAFIDFQIVVFPFGLGVTELVLSQLNIHPIERLVFVLACIIDPGRYSIFDSPIVQFDLTLNLAKLFNRFLTLDNAYPMSKLILQYFSLLLSKRDVDFCSNH